MEKNTQLPAEVENKLRELFPNHAYSTGQRIDIKKFVVDMHAAYATKLQELQQENVDLKRWKQEAIQLLAPIMEYGQGHKDAKLGGSCTEFVLNRCMEYDKLKEKATGWRPLLEEVLGEDTLRGTISTQTIENIKKFLYGE